MFSGFALGSFVASVGIAGIAHNLFTIHAFLKVLVLFRSHVSPYYVRDLPFKMYHLFTFYICLTGPFPSFAGCYKITTVFSHAQTVVLCVGCSTVLCQPTGGKARLTEGTCSQSYLMLIILLIHYTLLFKTVYVCQ